MNYTSEHHPHCSRFHSFDMGDSESTSPPCSCSECSKCKGSGSVVFNTFQAGDQTAEEFEDCSYCDGLGRILTDILSVDYKKGYPNL